MPGAPPGVGRRPRLAGARPAGVAWGGRRGDPAGGQTHPPRSRPERPCPHTGGAASAVPRRWDREERPLTTLQPPHGDLIAAHTPDGGQTLARRSRPERPCPRAGGAAMAVQRRWDREERPVTRAQAPIGDLIRDLGQDSVDLVRQEINLAKLEIKESVSQITRGAIGAALWGGIALVGGLALTACLILLIGMALDGAYWAGALIVGAVFVLLGALMAWRSVNKIRETD